MPQVASSPVIQSVRPEPSGRRPAASDDSPGTFGEMLDASAGSSTPGPDGANSAGNADGAAQSKDGNEAAPAAVDAAATTPGSAQTKAAGAAPASTDEGQTAPGSAGDTPAPVITPVDLTILAQTMSGDAAADPSPRVPSGKASAAVDAAATAGTSSSDKTDGSDDDAPSGTIPNVTAVAIPATTIVAVPAPLPAQSDVPVPDVAPDVNGATPTLPAIAPQAAATPDAKAPGDEPASPLASGTSEIATPSAIESDEPADTPAPRVEIAARDPGAEKSQPADSAAASEASAKAGPLPTVGLADPATKTSPGAISRNENPKAESTKTGAPKIEKAGNSDEPTHPDAKRTAPHPADEAHAGIAAEPDSRTAVAHQPHGQPSEHASATARVALTAAHSDVPPPATVAQSVTAQLGSNPAALGVNLAAPTSPLQSLWQAAPQRADTSDNAVPIAGVAVEIVSRAQDGLRRFEIRLDPPELGRIDVRLDVDNGGNVTSRLTVERAETLDLLRRDAPQLERALQHAGLNTEGGLQFSLRDQNFANRDQTPRNAPTFIVPDDEPAAAEAARRGYGRLLGLGGGIDIRV